LSNPRPFSRLGATAAGNTSRRGMTFFSGSKHMTGGTESHRSHRPVKRKRKRLSRAEREEQAQALTVKFIEEMATRHFNEFQVAVVAAALMGLDIYSVQDRAKEGDQDTLFVLRHIQRVVFEEEALKRMLVAVRTAVLR